MALTYQLWAPSLGSTWSSQPAQPHKFHQHSTACCSAWHRHAPGSCLQPHLHGQHTFAHHAPRQHRQHRQHRRVVVLASTKPSHNIFERVEQDLLPDGKPNTAWRRLLIRIRSTQTLADLTYVWHTNHFNTLVWKPLHGAAVLQRAALLAYPAALLAPQAMVSGHARKAAQANDNHAVSSAHTQMVTQEPAAAAVRQQEGPRQARQPNTGRVIERNKQQQPAKAADNDGSFTPWSAAGLPAVFTRTPEEFQLLLTDVGPSVSDTAVVRLLSGTCLIQLLYSAVQLHCVLPPALQQALLGELLRDACKKLKGADIGLIHDLVVALSVLHPPTAEVSAAVGSWTSQFVSAPMPSGIGTLLPPTTASVPAFLGVSVPTSLTISPAGLGLQTAPSTDSAGGLGRHAGQQQDQQHQREGHKELSFQAYLQQHAQQAVPTPHRPTGKRRPRPSLTTTGGISQASPPEPTAVPGGDVLSLWMEVTRAALQVLLRSQSSTATPAEVSEVRLSEACRLVAVLSQQGCLPPAVAAAFKLQLEQMGGLAAQQIRNSSTALLNKHHAETSSHVDPSLLHVAARGHRLMDWSHQVTAAGSHLSDPWYLLAGQHSQRAAGTAGHSNPTASQPTTTAATYGHPHSDTAAVSEQESAASLTLQSPQHDESQDGPDVGNDELDQQVEARLPHHPTALADLIVTYALSSQQGAPFDCSLEARHAFIQTAAGAGASHAGYALNQPSGVVFEAGHAAIQPGHISNGLAQQLGSSQHARCLHALLRYGGCMERFLWLLPEASLTDITRVCWSLAVLAPAAAKAATGTESEVASASRQESSGVPSGQHSLEDVLAVLCGFIQSAPYRWTTPHLVCMCEAMTQLQPHQGPAAPCMLAHLTLLAVEDPTSLVEKAPLELRLRLLESLTLVQQQRQQQHPDGAANSVNSMPASRRSGGGNSNSDEAHHGSSASSRRGIRITISNRDQSHTGSRASSSSQPGNSSSSSLEKRVSSSSGSSGQDMDAVLMQALPLLVCSLATSMQRLTLRDLATLVTGVSQARRLGVVDCVMANQHLRRLQSEDHVEQLLPDGGHDDWWMNGPGLLSDRNPSSIGLSSDTDLLKQVHMISLQNIIAGRLNSAAGVARLSSAWMDLGCESFAQELMQQVALLRTV